jgi:hypothetical protein
MAVNPSRIGFASTRVAGTDEVSEIARRHYSFSNLEKMLAALVSQSLGDGGR